MSRKALYRAWDKKYNVMLEGFGISAEGDHIGMSWDDSKAYYTEEQMEADMGGHFGSGDDWTYILNDFELMQWTGLKDKNGKDIYEGDILSVQRPDDTMKVICKFGTVQRNMDSGWRVDITGFYFERPDGLDNFPIVKNWAGKHDLEVMEVIGNIYES